MSMLGVLEINEVINSILISARFEKRVNVLNSDSGTGKTFLFNLLSAGSLFKDCSLYNLSFGFVNYNSILNGSLTTEQLVQICKGKDVVLMDDADLYLTRSLMARLLAEFPDLMFIISIKFLHSILNVEGGAFYTVEHTPRKLTVKRYG